MTRALLLQQQICDANTDMGEYLLDFEFIKAFSCTYANELGWLVLGLLVYGGITLSIYIRTGNPIVPAVLVLILGGAVLAQLPAIASPVVMLLLIAVPAGIVAMAYYLYSR